MKPDPKSVARQDARKEKAKAIEEARKAREEARKAREEERKRKEEEERKRKEEEERRAREEAGQGNGKTPPETPPETVPETPPVPVPVPEPTILPPSITQESSLLETTDKDKQSRGRKKMDVDLTYMGVKIPSYYHAIIKDICPEKYKNPSEYVRALIENDFRTNGQAYERIHRVKEKIKREVVKLDAELQKSEE